MGLIKDALADARVELYTAHDAVAGLETFRRIHPQIVLLDLVMSGIHGWQPLEQILVADPGTEVVIITAHYSTGSIPSSWG